MPREDEEGVIVAVIDNGFDTTHPDLIHQLWTNVREIPDDGVDNDDNGYLDDVHGWDFLGEDNDVSVDSPEQLEPSPRSHGTSVAGIIAAETNNGFGVASGCPSCELMLLRARDFRTERSAVPRLSEAIRYAVHNGARVISFSDGRYPDNLEAEVRAELREVVAEASERGVVVVASAGNDSRSISRWPAGIDEALSVASVDWHDHPSSWTNYGEEVDVAAPGECVFTTAIGGGYRFLGGTSASAPIVAALAARLLAEHPEFGPSEVAARMAATARPPLFDERPELSGLLGAGVVDFANALADNEP